MRDTKCTTWS